MHSKGGRFTTKGTGMRFFVKVKQQPANVSIWYLCLCNTFQTSFTPVLQITKGIGVRLSVGSLSLKPFNLLSPQCNG